MFSNDGDYLKKVFEFSEKMEGIEMRFIDKEIEEFYIKENHIKEMGKSNSFFVILMLGYIVAVGLSIAINKTLIRTTYIIIGCFIVEILLFIVSKCLLERFRLKRFIRIFRFLLIYLSVYIIIMFPVNKDKTQIIRNLYMFFAYTNLIYTYYVEFNYFIVILIPLLNSFLIVFVQYYEEFDKYYLLPEFTINISIYIAIFIIKKYDFLLNKKLFFEIYKNKQYFNYIKQFLDVINTQIICFDNQEVIFMNNMANQFFEKKYNSNENEYLISNKDNTILDTSFKKTPLNTQILNFFKLLKLNYSDTTIDSNNTKKLLYDSIFNFSEENSETFTKLGYFNHEKSNLSFEIFIRKLQFKKNLTEIILYNISDIRQAEQIKVESVFKKRILAKIAHEFKTPLINIISLISRMMNCQKNPAFDTDFIDNLTHITNLSNYTLTLIGDITQYVSDSTNLKLYKQEINIKDIIEFGYNVLDTLIKCNENKVNKVKTKLVIKDKLDKIRVFTDENRIKQILLNFVSNAYKFTLNGVIKVKAKLIQKDQIIEICVKDTGLGIKPEKQHLVFQEYTQFNVSNELNSKGTGLGLSICKQISNLLNHKIGFFSKYGKGSKFYIRLRYKNFIEDLTEGKCNNSNIFNENKLNLSQNEVINSNSIRSQVVKKNSNINVIKQINNNMFNKNDEYDDYKSTITKRNYIHKIDEMNYIIAKQSICFNDPLYSSQPIEFYEEVEETINPFSNIIIIDDHKLIRENFINLLKSVLISIDMSSKFNIVEGCDGIELLNMIRLDIYNHIKCIFIDENMEYLNGSETISIIRNLEKSQKIRKYLIVSTSALDDEYSKIKLEKAGADIIIPKPCTKSDLLNILTKLN